MTVHLVKLCVGADDVNDLAQWQKHLQKTYARVFHTTRMVPRRVPDLLDNGSIYWVIKRQIRVRQQIADIEEFVDDDGSGEIDFDEFVKLMERSTNTENAKAIQENKEISRDWRTAFDIFDADRDGLLSAEDLASSLKSFGRVLSRAEAQAMIDDVDVNNNGCITLNEFINKLESIRTNISSQQC